MAFLLEARARKVFIRFLIAVRIFFGLISLKIPPTSSADLFLIRPSFPLSTWQSHLLDDFNGIIVEVGP